ncbi:Cloroperoxidase [Exidia glandulosa HHB12029]|uniref:Cloroperoxidase n=1 Tax=Exidia glandulosa HHB12029 TaxID=1314781 RepID=A0A165EKN2_EXIGL|nr:Cloroperoxidase [Exidia glandulosa HHB12029]
MLPALYVVVLVCLCGLAAGASHIPAYASLAGRSDEEIALFMRNHPTPGAQPPPPPIKDTSSKLVNDRLHPWLPLLPGQIRGVCPGLNTLASHGWLPRSGVATPGQIVTAVQEGFNMGSDLAQIVTYAAMLVDGNHLTNLLSIGAKSRLTGPDPPQPALVGGLNTHGVFEGDASLTRGDAFFGDNHSFNESLFDEIVATSQQFGGGKYNLTVAAEVRFNRLVASEQSNPEFFFGFPRFGTAYAEAAFPLTFFIGGPAEDNVPTNLNASLDLDVMKGFFRDSRMPKNFHRREGPLGLDIIGGALGFLSDAHPFPPGFNTGAGNYTIDQRAVDILTGNAEIDLLCALYLTFVNTTIELYPRPTGLLRKSIAVNLHNLYLPLVAVNDSAGCPEQFPFGKF